MKKIHEGMDQFQIFDELRKEFKGMDMYYIVLPDDGKGDVVLMKNDWRNKTPELNPKRNGFGECWGVGNDRLNLGMIGWARPTYIVQSAIADEEMFIERCKTEGISIPMELFKKLAGNPELEGTSELKLDTKKGLVIITRYNLVSDVFGVRQLVLMTDGKCVADLHKEYVEEDGRIKKIVVSGTKTYSLEYQGKVYQKTETFNQAVTVSQSTADDFCAKRISFEVKEDGRDVIYYRDDEKYEKMLVEKYEVASERTFTSLSNDERREEETTWTTYSPVGQRVEISLEEIPEAFKKHVLWEEMDKRHLFLTDEAFRQKVYEDHLAYAEERVDNIFADAEKIYKW